MHISVRIYKNDNNATGYCTVKQVTNKLMIISPAGQVHHIHKVSHVETAGWSFSLLIDKKTKVSHWLPSQTLDEKNKNTKKKMCLIKAVKSQQDSMCPMLHRSERKLVMLSATRLSPSRVQHSTASPSSTHPDTKCFA
jgi:hypothetical protein